ncbi:MAG TPA: multidrug effflux MFS transporter [Rhabdochlamydiaceae bacterium]
MFLIIISFVAACIETDIYLPAFPDMMAAFDTTEGAIQSLLTWNFIAICLAGPFYGPLSDAFGRKKPLLIALGIFLAGSVITLFSHNLEQMLAGRVLQGLGSGGCFTLGTAIIFDAFENKKAINALSTLNTIIPLVMAAAPMVGGYLNHAYGFRSNFLAIAIFVLISFIVSVWLFEETLPKEKRNSVKIGSMLADFKEACCCLGFWQLSLCMSLLFAGYIAFLSGSAILFVLELGISKALFPFFQGAILGAWVAGSLCLNRALNKWGTDKIKKAGTFLIIFGSAWLLLAVLITPRNAWMCTAGLLPYAFGANWIMGLYFPEGMQLLPRIKGVTSSLFTSLRLLIAALVVGLTSALYNATIYPLAAVVIGTTFLIVPVLIAYEKKRVRTPSEPDVQRGAFH